STTVASRGAMGFARASRVSQAARSPAAAGDTSPTAQRATARTAASRSAGRRRSAPRASSAATSNRAISSRTYSRVSTRLPTMTPTRSAISSQLVGMIAVWGIGSPRGRRKRAVTANQSARPPTIPASAIARIQPPHHAARTGMAATASATAARSTISARRRCRGRLVACPPAASTAGAYYESRDRQRSAPDGPVEGPSKIPASVASWRPGAEVRPPPHRARPNLPAPPPLRYDARMLAAVLQGPRSLALATVPTPTPGPTDAVVRVKATGLCGTDYRIWTGERPVRYPRVMGHEVIGTVAAVGSEVRHLTIGQVVAVEPNYSCGTCPLCREGNRNLCLARVAVGIDVDGGFAEQATVPARCCWPAPAGVAEDTLLMVEPLAVVVRAIGRGAPQAGESAAVLGLGSLGLLAVQALRARGVRVLAVARSPRRLGLARELGAEAAALSGAGEDVGAARALSGREGVDLVIETAGTAAAVEQATNLCRPGGRVVLTGLPHEPSSLNFFWVVRRELQNQSSMIY